MSGRRKLAWDRFWAEVHGRGNAGPCGFTRWAMSYLRESPFRDVLDLGCGPGRDLSFLLSNGFAVTGIDYSDVAVSLAQESLGRLPGRLGTNGKVVRAELIDFLRGLPGRSVGGVHAAATYQSLTSRGIREVFEEVSRVLRAGGLHVWSIRNDRHAGAVSPSSVAPNFPRLGYTIPLHFCSLLETQRLARDRFERIGFMESPMAAYYLADRRR